MISPGLTHASNAHGYVHVIVMDMLWNILLWCLAYCVNFDDLQFELHLNADRQTCETVVQPFLCLKQMYCHAVLILCKDRIIFFIIKYLVHEFDIYHEYCYNSTKYCMYVHTLRTSFIILDPPG